MFTWGHRLVTPKRIVVARSHLKFHRSERLHVVSIAAGMVHSVALSHDGALFYWVSSDPDLKCQQVYHHDIIMTPLTSQHVKYFFLFFCSYIHFVGKIWLVYLRESTGRPE